ncbi:MAG: hypothetical protein K6F73_08565 [Lachnospiraceae bacterium]|nr:hypothetical protein [Lachnospiraceae bacterium]
MDFSKIRISNAYYILVALGYVLTLVFADMRPGVFGAFLMILVLGELILKKEVKINCTADAIAIIYFAYQILSVIWLLAGGFPFSVFIEEFVSSTLPMVFYFVGRSSGKNGAKWFMTYIIAIMLLGIIGVVFYITAPDFYCRWAYDWGYISKPDAATMRVRMHSVIGSTCLSFISVAGMLAGSYFLTGHGDEEKSGTKKRTVIFAVAATALSLLFAIMANQRSGLVAAALVIIYINYLLFFKLDMIPRKFFIYEVIAIAAVFALICAVKFEFILKFWYRIISLPTAISQRSEQWVAAVNNMYSSWIGNGLGANGHKALGIEDAHVIADGGLVKLYCENGVIGFSLWVYLLFLALSDGAKNIRERYAEAGIIAVAVLQSIGSNMLAFQICAPVFWFAVGRCISCDRARDIIPRFRNK